MCLLNIIVILLLSAIVCCTKDEKYDPTKVDYCKSDCSRSEKHTACHCDIRGHRQEILDNIVEFRRIMLDEHNRFRELVASGRETRNGVTSAADMQALSYSLELEYIARCFARNSYVGDHDSCRDMVDGTYAGQNLIGSSVFVETLEEIAGFVKYWYGSH